MTQSAMRPSKSATIRRRIRPVISLLLVLILGLLFALTLLSSRRAERQFTALAASFNRSGDPVVHLEVTDYQRGLFVSRATTSLQLVDHRYHFDHQLRHFAWGLTLTSTPVAPQNQQGSEEQSAVPRMVTRVTPFGAEWTLNATDLQTQGPFGQLQVADLELTASSDLEGRSGTWHGTLERLSLTSAGEALQLKNLLLTGHWADPTEQLSEIDLKAARIALQQGTRRGLSGREVQLSIRSGLSESAAFINLQLEFDSIATTADTVGPGELQLSLEDLPTAQLETLRNRLKPLCAPLLNRKTDSLTYQLQLLSFFSTLLDIQGRLELTKLQLQTANGRLQGQGTLTLQPNAAGGSLAGLLNRIVADIQLNASGDSWTDLYRLVAGVRRTNHEDNRRVAERARHQALTLIDRGILVQNPDGEGYRMDLQLQGGRLQLNQP